MRGAPRWVLCSLLTAAIGLGDAAAAAADAEPGVKALESRGGLESRGETGDRRPAVDGVQARYVRTRDIGRGVLFGGFGVTLAGIIMFALVVPRVDRDNVKYTSYPIMGVGAVMMIVGGAIWARNFRRLERLEQVGLALGRRGRVRLTAGAGLGLTF